MKILIIALFFIAINFNCYSQAPNPTKKIKLKFESYSYNDVEHWDFKEVNSDTSVDFEWDEKYVGYLSAREEIIQSCDDNFNCSKKGQIYDAILQYKLLNEYEWDGEKSVKTGKKYKGWALISLKKSSLNSETQINATTKEPVPFIGKKYYETNVGITGSGTPQYFLEITENGNLFCGYHQENKSNMISTNEKILIGKYKSRFNVIFPKWGNDKFNYKIEDNFIYEIDKNNNVIKSSSCCHYVYGEGVDDNTSCECKGELYSEKNNLFYEFKQIKEPLYFILKDKKIEIDIPSSGFDNINFSNSIIGCESITGQGTITVFKVVKENNQYNLYQSENYASWSTQKKGEMVEWKESDKSLILKFNSKGEILFIDKNYKYSKYSSLGEEEEEETVNTNQITNTKVETQKASDPKDILKNQKQNQVASSFLLMQATDIFNNNQVIKVNFTNNCDDCNSNETQAIKNKIESTIKNSRRVNVISNNEYISNEKHQINGTLNLDITQILKLNAKSLVNENGNSVAAIIHYSYLDSNGNNIETKNIEPKGGSTLLGVTQADAWSQLMNEIDKKIKQLVNNVVPFTTEVLYISDSTRKGSAKELALQNTNVGGDAEWNYVIYEESKLVVNNSKISFGDGMLGRVRTKKINGNIIYCAIIDDDEKIKNAIQKGIKLKAISY